MFTILARDHCLPTLGVSPNGGNARQCWRGKWMLAIIECSRTLLSNIEAVLKQFYCWRTLKNIAPMFMILMLANIALFAECGSQCSPQCWPTLCLNIAYLRALCCPTYKKCQLSMLVNMGWPHCVPRRCSCPTILPGCNGHYGGHMVDPDHPR